MVIHDNAGTGTAELLKALLDCGKLRRFAQEVEDGGPAWHAVCFFEDDMLAFRQRNRFCGVTDGWRICVGYSRLADDVPEYVANEWGPCQAWLAYHGDPVTIEKKEGVTVHGEAIGTVRADAPLDDCSGMRLNLLLKL